MGDSVRLKVTRPGEGNIAACGKYILYDNPFRLRLSLPISIFSAIFLAEYAKKRKDFGFDKVCYKLSCRHTVNCIRAVWHAGVCKGVEPWLFAACRPR